MKEMFKNGPWMIEYDLSDGARLSRLCYRQFDLLTTEPDTFNPPETDYGTYETRPVYGYDDCFPSVEVSTYPGKDWKIPDHGELCWLEWDVDIQADRLVFSVESKILPIVFKRILHFGKLEVRWTFEVENSGDETLPFQHVIHPLIKLNDIRDLRFPEFESVNNDKQEQLNLKTADSLREFLLSREEGDTHMLFVQKPEKEFVQWTYKNGLKIHMTYPAEDFSSIGIWWNNSGYPDEAGCRRNECAFEPIPGPSSRLMEAYNTDGTLAAGPGETKSWEIVWNLEYR